MIDNPKYQPPNVRLVLSFDDQSPLNLVIAKKLKELDLVATFFIESRGAEYEMRALLGLGMEIGCHTFSHPSDLKQLALEEVRGELEISKKFIENITGKPCDVLAYPRGRYNDDVVEMAKTVGFKEARTTRVMMTDVPDPMRMPTTIHVYSGREEYKGQAWLDLARYLWKDVCEHGGIFHLWGHANEIERNGEWDSLWTFLEEIKKPRG